MEEENVNLFTKSYLGVTQQGTIRVRLPIYAQKAGLFTEKLASVRMWLAAIHLILSVATVLPADFP